MAYVAGDISVVVAGTLGSAESFSNSWAFKSAAATPDPQDAVDILHAFYTDLATVLPSMGSEWTAENVRVVLLSVPIEVGATWTPIDGTNGEALLPTECAIRVSLTTVGGARGGPFLSGFTANCLDEDGGLLTGYQSDVKDALDNMSTALTTSDWTLGLRRPTVPSVEEVVTGRVGRIFDVIRRRRNDLPEGYTNSVFA